MPSQARGRERVDRILGAAAEEFARHGYDTATVSAIAERASTSIGSVYQFFGDKAAILDALVERYEVDLAGIGAAAALAAEGGRDGRELADVLRPVVDDLVAYCRANPAFPRLLAASAPRSLAAESVHRMLRGVVAGIVAVKHPEFEGVERIARVLTDILGGLLPAVLADAELVPHLKAALEGYLEVIGRTASG